MDSRSEILSVFGFLAAAGNAAMAIKGYYDMMPLIPVPLIISVSLGIAGTCLFILLRNTVFYIHGQVKSKRERRAQEEAARLAQEKKAAERDYRKPLDEAVKYVASQSVISENFLFHDSESSAYRAVIDAVHSGSLKIGGLKGHRIVEITAEEQAGLSFSYKFSRGKVYGIRLMKYDKDVYPVVFCDPNELYRVFPSKGGRI